MYSRMHAADENDPQATIQKEKNVRYFYRKIADRYRKYKDIKAKQQEKFE